MVSGLCGQAGNDTTIGFRNSLWGYDIDDERSLIHILLARLGFD